MVAQGRIAHFNAARLLHPPGDHRVAGFVDNVSKVNAIAERSEGFVWRLADESSQVAVADYQGQDGDPCVAFSMSVWETIGNFEQFVQKTVHGAFLKRRAEWFAPWNGPNYVIWDYDGDGPIATEEGWERLRHLAAHGPTAHAYDFGFAKAAGRDV
jgi:hypothetical protein